MTMVERVSDAINAKLEARMLLSLGEDMTEEISRAAIEALRKPTEQQLFKMSQAAFGVGLPVIREIYAAAIDAALAEQP